MRLTRSANALAVASLCLVAHPLPAHAAPASAGVASGLVKIRPGDPVPAAGIVQLDAARNEFEPFQIVVGGGDTGVTGVTVAASGLSGPAGAQIAATEIMLYREGLYQVGTPSNTEGAPGAWPDPLIPAVDAYVGETRNAFPFDVPTGESRAVWGEVFVPPGTPAGTYTGSISVTGDPLGTLIILVSLRVRNFDLPATASLKSAFGIGWADTCIAHRGSYAACGDAGVEHFNTLYAQAALDHRVSLESVVYDGPHDGDFTHFDATYGALLEGQAPTRLEGARMTSLRIMTGDPVEMTQWKDHFDGRGWGGALFDYTCDEPPAGCAFGDIPGLAAPVHAAGIRTLVTTDIDELLANMVADDIDIAVPIVNFMNDKGGVDRRADYAPFLDQSAAKELWMYQSCMSHGCGGGCVGTSDSYFTGWPSYMVDASALQNRAMEWLSFNEAMTGELYFQTTIHLDAAWDPDGVCDFSGQGDGTLFYPGTPARIGGATDIPIESIRLKEIREGMEDYEYLALVSALGDPTLARTEAATLFPAPYLVTAATPDELYAARSRLADRIEALVGGAPPGQELVVKQAGAAIAIDGSAPEFEGATPLVVTAGGASATIRMLWDTTNLYVTAEVTDPDLWVHGTGRDGALYDADGVELLLDPQLLRGATPDPTNRHVIVTAAGDLLDAAGVGASEDVALTMGIQLAVVPHGTLGDTTADTGYTIELAVPWTALGVTPAADLLLGGDLAVNDAAMTGVLSGDWSQLTSFAKPNSWQTLRLSSEVVGPDACANGVCAPDDGCACRVGARRASSPSGSWPLGAACALALAFALTRRRRQP